MVAAANSAVGAATGLYAQVLWLIASWNLVMSSAVATRRVLRVVVVADWSFFLVLLFTTWILRIVALLAALWELAFDVE
jgi:hypothetical protein